MADWRKKRERAKRINNKSNAEILLEIDYLRGMQSFVGKELKSLGLEPKQSAPNSLQLAFRGNLHSLKKLKTVVAVYQLLEFDIPRPKALLGQENFQKIIKAIKKTISGEYKYKAFRINAAGSGSSVYQRLASEISKNSGLKYDSENGELLIRIRKNKGIWQLLLRQSPKPLSARDWRKCNMSGGLNATVAYAMNDLAKIKKTDSYLNAMCGSATLLIEKNKSAETIGLDNSAEAISCAQKNLSAANANAKLELADALNTQFTDKSFDIITADLPWGDAIGVHKDNAALYRSFLKESARIAKKDARLVLLTHELKIFEKIIAGQDNWQLQKEFQVYHGGHYPKIFLLTKSARADT